MRCHDVEDLMMRYADGRLGADLARKVDTHLEVCPRCRAAYEEEIELVAAFHADGLRPAGAPLVQAVMRDIEAVEAEGRRAQQAPVRIGPSAATAVMAAAAVALLTLWQSGWLAQLGTTAVDEAGAIRWQLSGAWASAESWATAVRTSVERAGQAVGELLGVSSTTADALLQQHLTHIGALTAVAAVACIALVGGFRRKVVEENRP